MEAAEDRDRETQRKTGRDKERDEGVREERRERGETERQKESDRKGEITRGIDGIVRSREGVRKAK